MGGDITPRRPLVQMKRIDASNNEASITDFNSVEALGQLFAVLGVLGKTKSEGRIPSLSFLPTLLSVLEPWQGKQGRDSSLPTCTVGMGVVYAHHSLEEWAQSLLFLGGRGEIHL